MFTVTRAIPVNDPNNPDQPVLTRDHVWHGLVLKAENALPFVKAISECEVLRRSDHIILREVVVKGERLQEFVTLYPKKMVIFQRLSGPATGHILNEIEEDPAGNLFLRFTFTFELEGIAHDSPEEREFAANMKQDYLSAVDSTLNAMRQMKAENKFPENLN